MAEVSIIAFILLSSFIVKEFLRRFKVPVVVSQIAVGIILGLPIIKSMFFNETSLSLVGLLSDLGIIFLLFLAGWEINIKKIMACARDAILIAFSSALLSFLLGFTLLYFFFADTISSQGFDPLVASTIFGLALSVTSEGTKVKVLMDLGKLDTRLGAVMLGAGTIDDIIEVLGLVLVLTLAHAGGAGSLYVLPLDVLFFGLFVVLGFGVASRVLMYVERKETDTDFFMIVLVLMFGVASLAEILHLGVLIGSISAGFIVQLITRRRKKKLMREKLEEEEVFEGLKLVTVAFIAPFFFVNIGLNFNFAAIMVNPVLLVGTIVIAFAGKILGTMLVKPFSGLKFRQLYVVGWAMNSRGAVELIIAITAFAYNLIPPEIFSVLVATSVVTTLTFPFILQKEIGRNPRVMD